MRDSLPYTLFARKLKSGKTMYYYQFRDEQGRRSVAKSTGCSTLAKAKKYCLDLYNNKEFELYTGISFKSFTKDFFAEDGDYYQWRAVNNRPLKMGTIRRYITILENQLMPYFENLQLKDITKDLCKKWIVWASRQWSPKTVNNAQGTLNIIFESAVDKKIMAANPLYKLGTRSIQKKDRNLLSIEEVVSVYNSDWINPCQKSAFLLAVITGMRIGEVMALQKTDIKGDAETGFYVNVTKDYSDKDGLQNSTKTYMSRYVPVPTGFQFPESQSEWLFPDKSLKNPIRPHNIYNTFVRRCESLGIKTKKRGITLHTMRNFYITYLRSKNISDSKIRAVTGHADKTMTDVYTYWKPEMFPEVYEAQKILFNAITK